MIIDFHTHIFPDALAEKAVKTLSESAGFLPATNANTSSLLADMRNSGVTSSVVLNTVTNTKQVTNVNEFAKETAMGQPSLFPFGSVHPHSEHKREIVIALNKSGIRGIKLHCDYAQTDLDSPDYYDILDVASDLSMPVVIHAGYDPYSPKHIHAMPDMVLKTIARFPKLKLVCAHFGGYRMWDEVICKLCGKDIYFDTALACERFGFEKQTIQKIIDNHSPDRILFGSDSPWTFQCEVLSFLQQLQISPHNREKLLWRNAATLLNL